MTKLVFTLYIFSLSMQARLLQPIGGFSTTIRFVIYQQAYLLTNTLQSVRGVMVQLKTHKVGNSPPEKKMAAPHSRSPVPTIAALHVFSNFNNMDWMMYWTVSHPYAFIIILWSMWCSSSDFLYLWITKVKQNDANFMFSH